MDSESLAQTVIGFMSKLMRPEQRASFEEAAAFSMERIQEMHTRIAAIEAAIKAQTVVLLEMKTASATAPTALATPKKKGAK